MSDHPEGRDGGRFTDGLRRLLRPPSPADPSPPSDGPENVAGTLREILAGRTPPSGTTGEEWIRGELRGPQGAAVARALEAAGDDPAPSVRRRARRLSCAIAIEEAEKAARDAPDGPEAARARMARTHLFAREIDDPRVIRAMLAIPREAFLPPDLRVSAYDDRPLPIGEGQTISQPYIVAYMTQALDFRGGERVLEVGTGCGYQSAVLAAIAGAVCSIEVVEPLARRAAKTLKELGADNVRLKTGDGYHGWPEAAPFDAAIVTCAPDHVPRPLVDQLRVGGRLIIPVGSRVLEGQRLLRVTRTPKGEAKESLIGVRFVPMTGEADKSSRFQVPGSK